MLECFRVFENTNQLRHTDIILYIYIYFGQAYIYNMHACMLHQIANLIIVFIHCCTKLVERGQNVAVAQTLFSSSVARLFVKKKIH